jgi:ABC-type dipeptide/oligopeptide/nickel transport system permease component
VAIPHTLLLASTSLIVALSTVVLIGVASSHRPRGIMDRVATLLTILGQSAPLFWIGLMLIEVFALHLGWLPSGGLQNWTNLVLPSISIALTIIPTELRIFTGSMRAELDSEYVRTARAFGISERRIHFRYAARNAILPLLTVVGMDMGFLLGGAIVAEVVFNYPGLGSLAITAFDARDYPLIQGLTMVAASLFVILNLLVDLIYVLVNPQIRLAA